jgi:hypothetical protein
MDALKVDPVMLIKESTIADLGSNLKMKILMGIINTPPPNPTIVHIEPIKMLNIKAKIINSSPKGMVIRNETKLNNNMLFLNYFE